jgi:hypothetical protein
MLDNSGGILYNSYNTPPFSFFEKSTAADTERAKGFFGII